MTAALSEIAAEAERDLTLRSGTFAPGIGVAVTPLVRLRGVSRRFGPVRALDDVAFDIARLDERRLQQVRRRIGMIQLAGDLILRRLDRRR